MAMFFAQGYLALNILTFYLCPELMQKLERVNFTIFGDVQNLGMVNVL